MRTLTTLRVSAAVEAEGDGIIGVRIKGSEQLHPDTHLVLAREVIAQHTGTGSDDWWPVQIRQGRGEVEMDLRLDTEASGQSGRRVRPGF